MGGIGGPEVLVILVVALLVFGPKSLPGVARGVGKGMRELRKLALEFQREMNLAELDDDDRRIAPGRRPGPPDPGRVRGSHPKVEGGSVASGEGARPAGETPLSEAPSRPPEEAPVPPPESKAESGPPDDGTSRPS